MITGIVTTFERPDMCARLIRSVREHAPDVRIVVVDDSRVPGEWPEADAVLHLPFDSGLGAKRNAGVAHVGSGWVAILDDDFVFTKDTRLGRLVELAEETDTDIMAGQVIENGVVLDYYATFKQDGSHVDVRRGWTQDGPVRRCEIVPNFFVARAEVLSAHPWLDWMKLGEHSMFFWRHRDRLRVAWTDEVSLEHFRVYPAGYDVLRMRVWAFKKEWADREGLTWTELGEPTLTPDVFAVRDGYAS
jgi:glycosyltransferase involved in cell wall biosynthesis